MDYGLILLGSFLASAHCIGMCGCFALLVGTQGRSTLARMGSQFVYSAGRLFTYTFLGVLAGAFGASVVATEYGSTISFALTVLSGAVFLIIGLEILGVWRRLGGLGKWASRWFTLGLGPLIRHFAELQSRRGTFVMGALTGFLPCGLVYAFTLRAASSGGAANGAWTMIAFGLGTIPAMTAFGWAGSLASAPMRSRIYRLSGAVLIVLGLLTATRGTTLYASMMGHSQGCTHGVAASDTSGDSTNHATCCESDSK